MQTWFIVRILGGVSFSLAHAQLAGLTLAGLGFVMTFQHALAEPPEPAAHHDAAEPELPATPADPADLPAWFASLSARRNALKTADEISAFNAEAARYAAALDKSRNAALPVQAARSVEVTTLSSERPERGSGLFTRRIVLEEKRLALNTADPEAVRRFNEEVAAYHAALGARKPLNDQLRPLNDALKPLPDR